MAKNKELTISADDDIKAWIDLPKGRIEIRIDRKLIYVDFND